MCVLRWFVSFSYFDKSYLQWLHVYGFSSVYVFRWFKIWLFCEKALSHWLHQYGSPPVWFFWCVIKTSVCVSPLIGLQCMSSDDLSAFYFVIKPFYNGYIYMVSPQCVSAGGLKEYYFVRKHCHTGCINMDFPQCEYSGEL